MSQTELAAGTFKDAPTITRIVDLLAKAGYVQREPDPADRRKHLVNLTEAGKAKIAEVFPTALEIRELGWQGLSNDDFATFKRILNTIEANLS